MGIDQLLTLQVGAKVRCPADRGDPPFIGELYDIPRGGVSVANGVEFMWCTVVHPSGRRSVWPSNRISKV